MTDSLKAPTPQRRNLEEAVTNVVQLRPAHKKPHPADDLSFMEKRTPSGTGINYWNVEPSGNYDNDCVKGRQLAREYMLYVGEHHTVGNGTLLGCIVGDMKLNGHGRLDPLAIAFLASINKVAMSVAAVIPDAVRSVD